MLQLGRENQKLMLILLLQSFGEASFEPHPHPYHHIITRTLTLSLTLTLTLTLTVMEGASQPGYQSAQSKAYLGWLGLGLGLASTRLPVSSI